MPWQSKSGSLKRQVCGWCRPESQNTLRDLRIAQYEAIFVLLFLKIFAGMAKRVLISFDWALKKLLRNKANFGILEGFLSELLRKDVTILSILESEANVSEELKKINRVDLLVENKEKERIIIELQYNREFDYFQRMLFATSKHIAENFDKGEAYQQVKKVYSVNLIYFDLGHGKDYVYHGKTEFTGIHTHDVLALSDRQKQLFGKDMLYQVYPEYYVIKINNFDGVAKDSLDEWIYYFKNNEVKAEFKAKGLEKVREHLRVEGLKSADKLAYDKYLEDLSSEKSVMITARIEGRDEGLKEGRVQEKRQGIVKALLKKKLNIEEISEDFEVSIEAILQIKDEEGL
jgi:PD-(D/E)XK nuclease family transposase